MIHLRHWVHYKFIQRPVNESIPVFRVEIAWLLTRTLSCEFEIAPDLRRATSGQARIPLRGLLAKRLCFFNVDFDGVAQ